MTTDLMLRLTQFVSASVERVFDAWLDPLQLEKFMRTGPTQTVGRVETDPRVGGRYLIEMVTESGAKLHHGEYREIDRPHRLAFTWNSPHASPDSVVTLTFRPVAGGTEVTLEHDRFPSDGARNGHEKGWTAILGELAALVEEGA